MTGKQIVKRIQEIPGWEEMEVRFQDSDIGIADIEEVSVYSSKLRWSKDEEKPIILLER